MILKDFLDSLNISYDKESIDCLNYEIVTEINSGSDDTDKFGINNVRFEYYNNQIILEIGESV